ncbi:MAG TPA: hypothetical protein VF290_02630 [Pyrinomonadaceae bacterium]
MSEQFVSLETFGQGAAIELFSDELEKVLNNVLDPNTKATATREVTLTLKIKPDEDRSFAHTSMEIKSKLAPTKPFGVPVYIGKHAGRAVATERDTRQLTFQDNVTELKEGAK